MARPRRIDPVIVKRAQLTAVASTSVESLRQCQAVLLPALLGATLEQTAAVLGVGRATVARLQGAFRKQRSALTALARNWGARRQSLLTQEEEDDFLKPWLASRSSPRWCIGCWRAMAGARWLPTPAIPRANPRFRRRGKKTPRSAGNPADTRRGQGASRSVDVS